MTKTKNFSYSELLSFSESLVDSLDSISNKIEEVTEQINTLEAVIGGDDVADADASAEENVGDIPEESVSEDIPPEEETVVSDEEETAEIPEDEGGSEEVVESDASDEESADVSDEENDAAAIDAMSTDDENFSSKYMVVGLKNRPWGNRVIKATDFSEKEHRKLIPTMFSTQAQAQRALTSFNANGENFSLRYEHVKGLLNM